LESLFGSRPCLPVRYGHMCAAAPAVAPQRWKPAQGRLRVALFLKGVVLCLNTFWCALGVYRECRGAVVDGLPHRSEIQSRQERGGRGGEDKGASWLSFVTEDGKSVFGSLSFFRFRHSGVCVGFLLCTAADHASYVNPLLVWFCSCNASEGGERWVVEAGGGRLF
jgi:hypothetical protein